MRKKVIYTMAALCTFFFANGQEELQRATFASRAAGNRNAAVDGEFFRATIKMGATANQFLVYLKPNTNVQDLVAPNPTALMVGGAPHISFSLPGAIPLDITPSFNLGPNPGFSSVFEQVGGRTRMTLATNIPTPIVLPWNADEERLAYTILINSQDTTGLRLEHDDFGGQYVFYMAESNTFSDWTHYSDPFYTSGSGAILGQDANYSYVTLGTAIVAPVTLKEYKVKCNDKGTMISWITATESNTSHFEIEKSVNGADWVRIDNVTAAGNSNSDRNYQYLDLEGGRAYYRIKQIDLDGKSVYTSVISANCAPMKTSVVLFPVPARDKLTVVVNSVVSTRTDLQVIDMSGKLVRRVPVQVNQGNNNFILNVNDLPGGQYMLTSSDPQIMINKKFTVNR